MGGRSLHPGAPGGSLQQCLATQQQGRKAFSFIIIMSSKPVLGQPTSLLLGSIYWLKQQKHKLWKLEVYNLLFVFFFFPFFWGGGLGGREKAAKRWLGIPDGHAASCRCSLSFLSPNSRISKPCNCNRQPTGRYKFSASHAIIFPHWNCSETCFRSSSEQWAQVVRHLGGITECCAAAGKKSSLPTTLPPCPRLPPSWGSSPC